MYKGLFVVCDDPQIVEDTDEIKEFYDSLERAIDYAMAWLCCSYEDARALTEEMLCGYAEVAA